jgi:hypothetical protein
LLLRFAISAVTDVLVHPRRLDTVLSSAADGTVNAQDTSLASASAAYMSASDNADAMENASVGEGCYSVCAEAAAVSCLDCDNGADRCTLLVGTAAGGITRVTI